MISSKRLAILGLLVLTQCGFAQRIAHAKWHQSTMVDPQSGTHGNLLVTCGKAGDIWVLDRNRLGGFSGITPNQPPGSPPSLVDNPDVVSVTELQLGVARLNGDDSPGPWGGPAYFNSRKVQLLYYCGNGRMAPGKLTAFSILGGVLQSVDASSDSYSTMGSIPVVSSNQQTNGIVWAVNRGSAPNGTTPITLRAYDATNLVKGLHPGNGWTIGMWAVGRAFVIPTVANGKVYVACEDHVGVFY